MGERKVCWTNLYLKEQEPLFGGMEKNIYLNLWDKEKKKKARKGRWVEKQTVINQLNEREIVSY